MQIKTLTAALLAALVTQGQVVAAAPEPPSYLNYRGGSSQQLKARDGGQMTATHLNINHVPIRRNAHLVRRDLWNWAACVNLAGCTVWFASEGGKFVWNRLPQWTTDKEEDWKDWLNKHPNIKWMIAGKTKYKLHLTKEDAKELINDALSHLNSAVGKSVEAAPKSS